ncbi:flippase [candidate division KSB1 bacterium]|nr:flippase [candidate division KSB1 bacterium]
MATKKYNMVKNVVFSSITTFSSFFLFVLLIAVGRALAIDDYGTFNSALAIATVFEMFTDLGLRDLSVRNVSRDRNLSEMYIGNLLSWKLILCAIIYCVMMIVVYLKGYEARLVYAIYLLTISAFLKSLKYTFRVFFQAHNLFAIDTGLVLLERTGLLVFCLIVLHISKELYSFILCFTAVRAVDFLITLGILNWKIGRVRFKFDFRFLKKLQIEALPLGMFFVILTIFSYIDIWMLTDMKGLHDVGLYSAAFRIYEGITILPTILFLVVLPRLSEFFVTDKKKHQDLAIRAVKYMFIMAMPIVVFGISFSDFGLKLFFSNKPEYWQASFALQTLFLGIMFQYPNWMLNTILISVDKQKIILITGSTGLLFKIILNYLVIPIYGYEGSAVATVLGEALIFTLCSIYLYTHHIKIPVFKISFKPLLAAALIFGIFFSLNEHYTIPFAGQAGIALGLTGLFIGLLLVLKAFSKEEIESLKGNVLSLVRKGTQTSET